MRIKVIIFNPIYVEIPEYSLRKAFKAYIENLVEGIDVYVIDARKIDDRFVLIELDGEDAGVAKRYLEKVFGQRLSLSEVLVGQEYGGRVISIHGHIVAIDIGLEENLLVRVDVSRFLSKLLRKPPDLITSKMRHLIRLLGIGKYMPVAVRVLSMQNRHIEGNFGRRTRNMFREWLNDRRDRVVVLGTLRAPLDKILKKTKLFKKIVRVDRLGFLEHAIVCRFGVFADEIADILRKNGFTGVATFMPRKLRKIVES